MDTMLPDGVSAEVLSKDESGDKRLRNGNQRTTGRALSQIYNKMPAAKIPLRTSIYPMGNLVAIGDEHTIGGAFGPFFQEHHDYYSEFNRTYVWVTDNTLVGKRVNSTFTGVMEHMWKNLSDACLLPNPRSPDADVVEFGLYMTTSPVIVVAPLEVREYPDAILTQLFRFSIDIVFLLLITMYVFARVLRKSEIRHDSVQGVLDGIWHMIQMMLNQVQVSPVTHAGRILVVMTVVGVFFWLQIWQNQMKMEMVAFDTSSLVRNLDEAVAANRTLIMTKTEAATLEVEHKAIEYPDSSLGKLYKTAQFNVMPSSHLMNMIAGLKNLTIAELMKYVVVVSAHLMGYMEGSLCVSLKSINKDIDFLYGDEIVVDIPTGPWVNPNLNPEYKAVMRKKSLKIKDHGLEKYFAELLDKETLKITQLLLPGPDAHCVFKSVEEFILLKMNHANRAMTVAQLSDVFRLLCYATCGALFVLCLEASGFMEVAASKYRVVQRRLRVPGQRRQAWPGQNRWKTRVRGANAVTHQHPQKL